MNLNWLIRKSRMSHCIDVDKTTNSKTHLVAVCDYQRLPTDDGDRIVEYEAYIAVADEKPLDCDCCEKCGEILYDAMVKESMDKFYGRN